MFTKVAATTGATTEITGTTVSFDDIMDVFHSLRSVYKQGYLDLERYHYQSAQKAQDNNGNYRQPSVVAGPARYDPEPPLQDQHLCTGAYGRQRAYPLRRLQLLLDC